MNKTRDIASGTISDDTIRDLAIKHYGLNVQHCRLLGTSENHGYELEDAEGQTFFARVHVYADRYAAHLPSEYDLLDQLVKAMPGSAPSGIRTKDGACFARFESDGHPYLFMMFTWLPGKHIPADDLSIEDAAAMAEATARFHMASQKMTYDFNRPVYDFAFYCGENSFFYRDDLQNHIASEEMTPFLKVKNMFEAYSANADPKGKGMIHYDLHLGNFLFDDRHARIIDFDECGHGYYLFDLGHILFAQHDHANYEELEAVFIERYEMITGTKLPMNDLSMFKGVQAIAIIHYFFRLWDRSGGKQNLLGYVPNIASSLRDVIAGL